MCPTSGFVCKAALLVFIAFGSAGGLRTALATDVWIMSWVPARK